MRGEPADEAAVRDRVWAALERARVVPVGVHGHIPDFIGSEQAARRLAELPRWRQARTVPRRPHDFTVDHVLTPDRVITCGPAHRPAGIDWEELGTDQINAIPVLRDIADVR